MLGVETQDAPEGYGPTGLSSPVEAVERAEKRSCYTRPKPIDIEVNQTYAAGPRTESDVGGRPATRLSRPPAPIHR